MSDNNYTLGRGELFFGKFKTGTQASVGEYYFGDTKELSLTTSSETLDHFSSDYGMKEKDATVTLQTTRSGAFKTESIKPENLSFFFLGTKEIVATVAAASQTSIIAPADVVQGYTYQLGVSAANPSGINKVDTVVVKNTITPTTIYALNVDYSVDPGTGRVTVLEGGAITDGTGITIGFGIAASSRSRIISGNQVIEGALRYISHNAQGEQRNYFMPRVKITPDGDFALKGDTWQELGFKIEILKKTGLEAIYCDGAPYTP